VGLVSRKAVEAEAYKGSFHKGQQPYEIRKIHADLGLQMLRHMRARDGFAWLQRALFAQTHSTRAFELHDKISVCHCLHSTNIASAFNGMPTESAFNNYLPFLAMSHMHYFYLQTKRRLLLIGMFAHPCLPL
jgi:hypothetical protein